MSAREVSSAERYRLSFEPLEPVAVRLLSVATGVDFGSVDFTNERVWCCFTAYDGEEPVIVIVFEFKSEHDAYLTLAITDPRALSRRLITSIYRAIFSRAGRVSALVSPDNQRALDQVMRMGFKYEGWMRRGYDRETDAVMFGLLPEDCPYLAGTPFRIRTVTVTHDPAQRMQ